MARTTATVNQQPQSKGNIYKKINYLIYLSRTIFENIFENKYLLRKFVIGKQVFSDVNRAGILHDVFKLSCDELLDPLVALNITKYLSKERDFIPWAMARSKSECIAMMIQDHSVKRKFKVTFNSS